MTSHTIVYLDQNYLSNMAKARLGFPMNSADSEFWRSLFDDLKAAVLANKIACPESQFQRKEARLDRRIEKVVGRIIDELSWGLEFNPWEVILRLQIEDAAYRFLGKNPPARETWSAAFKSDPQTPVESRMEKILGTKGRIVVSFSPPDEVIEEDRQSKLEFMDEAQEILNRYSNNPLSWSELLLQSKKGVVDSFMGKQAQQSIAQQLQRDSPLDKLRALQNLKELEDLWNWLHWTGINTNDSKMVMEFAESKELLDSPFIEVNASIWAAVAECGLQGRKGRKRGKGDFYDAPILATALPYCDVVATDSFMKEIVVKRFHFDEKYQCNIFSANKTDRQAFQKLIKKLK
jgi:hypothetical protein